LGLPGRYVLVEGLAPYLQPRRLVRARVGCRLSIVCDLRDLIQRQIYYGLYEPAETGVLASVLKAGDVFLDVGANVGYYSLLAAEIVGTTGQVHAFEPIEQNTRILETNAIRNGLRNIVVNRLAVTDGSALTITIFLRRGVANSGWASVIPSVTRENIPLVVPTMSLDAYVAERGLSQVHLIKMDIEGAEAMAIKGANYLLSRPDAPAILMEVSTWQLRQNGSSVEELCGRLANLGYALQVVTGHGPMPLSSIANREGVWNVLATKPSSA